ncbi:hypothetical protein CGCA056_v006878 [Colletotrichum aenigma]|uniref:uncharacterized protein n=1 Tax=Colletotrichum aenigma TaxID=1215731 RepID=UPI0018723F05|nr:uncharacterized protein CGCA056_v006878 [Colletotrichum aenigma]KAF5522752.1 hypothetical protein CGCA056_v006878 [Colletotrichum aenigma]
MAHPNFKKTHDVQSFAKLYQEKERKQKERRRQKCQRQLEEPQKHQQTSANLSTVLATPLEQDVGALILTETQASGYTSGGLANSFSGIDNLEFNFIEVFDTAELYNSDTLGDIAHTTEPFAPISDIGGVTAEITKPILPDEIKSSESWSTYTPVLAQPPTEPSSQEVATASSRSEHPLAPDLVRRSTEQLHLTSCLGDMNTDIAGSKERSESSDTRESCGNNGSAKDDYGSSYDNDTKTYIPPDQHSDRQHASDTDTMIAHSRTPSTSAVYRPIIVIAQLLANFAAAIPIENLLELIKRAPSPGVVIQKCAKPRVFADALYGCIYNQRAGAKKACDSGHQIASHNWTQPQNFGSIS